MPALPTLRKYRLAGVLSFVAAATSFAAAFFLEVTAPGTDLTRGVFWAGVALMVIFLVTVYLSLFRVAKLRGVTAAESRDIRVRATWGGPLGALFALWGLTENRGNDAGR